MRASAASALFIAATFGATPAAALSGAELLSDVCFATFPQFRDAPQRAVALGGRAIEYDGRLFEQIEAERRQSFVVSDGPGTAERFLVNVAWGNLDSRPAASCLVIDKGGIALADIGAKVDIKEIRVRPEKVLYTTVAVAERPDGRHLVLTLMLMPGQSDPRTGRTIASVTLIASEALDQLIERPR